MSTQLKIVSWNIAHTTAAWTVLSTIGADVALLQEAVPPPSALSDIRHVIPPSGDWRLTVRGLRPFATTIATPNREVGFQPIPVVPLDRATADDLAGSHPGQFTAARVTSQGSTLAVVSLYGVWEYQKGVGYSEATLHRAVSDLTPLLQSKEPLLIAGDLNIFRGYTLDGKKYSLRRYDSVFERLEAYDVQLIGPTGDEPLVGCRCCSATCNHVRTYRHMRKDDSKPDQLDFVFANAAARSWNPHCEVIATEATWAVSDHAPVLTTLTIG